MQKRVSLSLKNALDNASKFAGRARLTGAQAPDLTADSGNSRGNEDASLL